jgi:hypothetical protein
MDTKRLNAGLLPTPIQEQADDDLSGLLYNISVHLPGFPTSNMLVKTLLQHIENISSQPGSGPKFNESLFMKNPGVPADMTDPETQQLIPVTEALYYDTSPAMQLKLETERARLMEYPGGGASELVYKFNLTQRHVNISTPAESEPIGNKWWKVPRSKWTSKFCPAWDPMCETFLVHEVFDISAWPTVDIVGFEPIITRIPGATEVGGAIVQKTLSWPLIPAGTLTFRTFYLHLLFAYNFIRLHTCTPPAGRLHHTPH